MDEIRIKKLEIDVHNLNRRVTDHDALHAESKKDILMLQQILEANKQTNAIIAEIAGYAKETLDVVKPLMKFLHFVGKISSWLIKLFAGAAIIWQGIKFLFAKLGFSQ